MTMKILKKTMSIFRKKTTPKEALRESKREMATATRGIEREIAALQLEEKKLVAEIKKTAKTGNEAATRILARQLVRLRQQITNLQGSRAQIRGVATHTQALHASTSISTGMRGATKAMVAMNKQMEPAKQAKLIKEFQKQSTQMDMTIEMMSESIDETLDKDEAEEETEELTNQVLDEIGVDIASQLSSAPKGRIASRNASNVVTNGLKPIQVLNLKTLRILRRDWPLFAASDLNETRSSQPGSNSFLFHVNFSIVQEVVLMHKKFGVVFAGLLCLIWLQVNSSTFKRT